MDYIHGPNLDELWPTVDTTSREHIMEQVAKIITKMQSIPVDGLPPDPIKETNMEPWRGPWFSDYGAGPFSTMEDMTDWYNHKTDDLAPWNIILEKHTNRLVLVDWGHAGIYPIGFGQGCLTSQTAGNWDKEFGEGVLEMLSVRREKEVRQLRSIGYGLTTAALL
ncbi:hypothetical protein BX600DRAFT_521910 [Xylariales sp. PMI_506]|nr:hypothetical protein BX600DRAFT_521910 [Xylariales sp. PMI_506]